MMKSESKGCSARKKWIAASYGTEFPNKELQTVRSTTRSWEVSQAQAISLRFPDDEWEFLGSPVSIWDGNEF